MIHFDHRDLGQSSLSETPFDLDDLVEDIHAILEGYSLQSAHLIGHSMGGYLAQLFSAKYPQKTRSITVISSGPVGETPELVAPHSLEEKQMIYLTWRIMLRNRPTEDFEESLEGFMDVWRRLTEPLSLDESMAKAYTKSMYQRSKNPISAQASHMQAMQKMAETIHERKDIFSQIKAPCLIIHGKQDPLVPLQRGGEALKKVLPEAKLEVIDPMGHMMFNADLEKQISKIILQFVNKLI